MTPAGWPPIGVIRPAEAQCAEFRRLRLRCLVDQCHPRQTRAVSVWGGDGGAGRCGRRELDKLAVRDDAAGYGTALMCTAGGKGSDYRGLHWLLAQGADWRTTFRCTKTTLQMAKSEDEQDVVVALQARMLQAVAAGERGGGSTQIR